MKIELKSVGNRVVVDASRQTAGACKFVTIETGADREFAQLIRSANGVAAAPSADRKAQLRESRIEAALQRSHHRRRNARRMPVHTHDAAQRLKPEGIAEAGQELGGAVRLHDVLNNCRTQLRHALVQQKRHTSAVQREVGGAGALHSSIFSKSGVACSDELSRFL